MTEIVILAMIAAFLGLRLYSVLGRRAEHEEEPSMTRFDNPPTDEVKPLAPASAQPQPTQANAFIGFPPQVEQGLRAISSADRSFDVISFMEGARSAYGMILESYWEGDRESLKELCDDDVYAGFDAAITARDEAGETLDNKLIRIEESKIDMAELDGRIARVTVRFVSDIAAVTRDKDGEVIAGSLDDAIESRDIWTFSHDTGSDSPAWLLDETDEG